MSKLGLKGYRLIKVENDCFLLMIITILKVLKVKLPHNYKSMKTGEIALLALP